MKFAAKVLLLLTSSLTSAFSFSTFSHSSLTSRIDLRTSLARIASKPQIDGIRNPLLLKAVAQEAGRKPILITGNNIEITTALSDYANKKVLKVIEKLGGIVTKVDVHLSVIKNPRVEAAHIAELTVFAKKTVIRAGEASENMYASIDLVTDIMARKLRKYKERNISRKRSNPPLSELTVEDIEVDIAEESNEDEDDDEDDVDPYGHDGLPVVDMSIVKKKSFPMPPCSVEDAVIALEYIDHDFYVFRNSETNEVNVLYKRNHGGLGLIEPEKDK